MLFSCLILFEGIFVKYFAKFLRKKNYEISYNMYVYGNNSICIFATLRANRMLVLLAEHCNKLIYQMCIAYECIFTF